MAEANCTCGWVAKRPECYIFLFLNWKH